MLLRFPCRLRSGVAAPLDQITELLLTPNMFVAQNVLDFEFRFTVNKFRKRGRSWNSILGGDDLWSKQRSMKYVMDTSGARQPQLVYHWRNFLNDLKGTEPPRRELTRCLQMEVAGI